ncbi:hypothetical protein CVIRNUC_009028 [Coccomyxa viridis]|uniref:Uncharacterized protein n=1 Tax=Coccomyxa viridis TaxID=1274662 RepID=A0AAV1IG74_9CHLO|nr:hypothetical protein CVIRNUC_009028 [Coccomyxa viridis]
MIRTMARVTDVHHLEDEDGVELPAKIVNEDLRRFFMPKKYAEPEPEPVSEPIPEADKIEDVRAEEATEEPKKEIGSFKEEPKSSAVPAELLRKSESHAQSPSKSAYAPGAFAPSRASPTKAPLAKSGSSKWWRLGSRKSRMAKDSASAKALPTPVRFVEKHAYAQPPAKEPQAAEAPLEPIAGEAQSDVGPSVLEPAAAEAAPAGEEHDGLAAEVTPAAEDSSAMAGSPIAEAVVALQQIMEPAPVPSPALEEDEALKEAQPEAAEVVPVAEETERTPEPEHAEHVGHANAAPLDTEALPVEEAAAAKEDVPVEAPAHEEEAVPVEAPAHEMEAGPVEASAHKKAVPEAEEVAGPVEAAAHKEAALPVSVPGAAQLPEEHAHDCEMPAVEEQPHQVEPEEAPADVEEPVAEPKAAERKAVTMSMLLREEVEGAEDHRPVTCRFVVDEGALPAVPMSTQSSPQKEMPINTWYSKGGSKTGKKGRGFFAACLGCFKG